MVSQEALIQILICLPVISLLRFKSVCKSWFALIGSSSFIAKHLHHRQHDHQHTSFVVLDCFYSTDRFLLVSSDSSTNLLDLPPFFNEGYEGCSKHDLRLKMVGSCDGIICLSCLIRSCLNLFLWNPATKQFRRLPPSSLHVLPRSNFRMDYGFGYDVKTNDYKVVRVVISRDEFSHPKHHLIEVYCLSTDSWKSIDTVLPVDMIISKKGTYLNGICFWLARNDFIDCEIFLDMYRSLIVTFDMTTEVFGTMPLPDVCGITSIGLKLALIRECVACINFVMGETITYDIWMLTEFGVKESWSKLYSVQVDANLLWLSNSGEFLLLYIQNHLAWCHAGTLDMKNLQVKFSTVCSDFIFYKESLVSVMG